jgi:chromosome partitioning protein
MSKVISISNHKGGVGKTTSAINLGAGLNKLGKNILLIDLDPQANLSQSLGLINQERNIYGALRGEYKLQPIEIIKGLEIIPSTLDLSGAEIEMSGEAGREYILRELIEPIRRSYDYILIDSPPSLGLLTINSFTASDEVFIPLQAQFLALQGLAKLLEVIDKIKKRLNKELIVGGVFITQYDNRKVLNRDVVATIEAHFKDEVFNTKIRDNIALAEAPAQGVDIFRYSPKSYGAEDYLSLCKEILIRKLRTDIVKISKGSSSSFIKNNPDIAKDLKHKEEEITKEIEVITEYKLK